VRQPKGGVGPEHHSQETPAGFNMLFKKERKKEKNI